jgi:predicted nucleic acid-binding protein
VSYSLDVNVLVYASDRSSDRHNRARRFVESCAGGPETGFRTTEKKSRPI